MNDSRARLQTVAGLLLSALLTSGCGDPDSPKPMEVESTSASILNNQVTWEQREVGWFNGCTATLISEGWFVTASHCIQHERKTSGFSNFEIDAPSPVSCSGSPGTAAGCPSTMVCGSNGRCVWSYPVKEVFPLGKVVEPEWNDNNSSEDVAIGKLVTPVPPLIARPAALANHSPPKGTTVTMLGYGCNTRHAGGTGGIKRYKTFPWYSSNASCKGDSGGPIRLGTLSSPGDLFSLTVGVNRRHPTVTDYDIRAASVLFFKPLIMAHIRAQDGWEFGFDRLGHDFRNFTSQWGSYGEVWGALECSVACQKDSRCRAFSYVVSNKRCFLKNAIPNATPKDGVISGPNLSMGQFDLPGSDYLVFTVARRDICESKCAQDTRCLAYTYDDAGRCRLKNATPAATTSSVRRSGYRRGFEFRVNRPGSDIRSFDSGWYLSCSDACAREQRCQSYTWVPAMYSNGSWSSARCWLKDGVPDPVRDTRAGIGLVTSGIRGGWEMDRNRAGSDFHVFGANTPEACQSWCERYANCQAWSYREPSLGVSGLCHLKDEIPEATFSKAMISGRRGMAFFN